MLKESGDNEVAHITFFGGETLLNFPVLAQTIDYARKRGAEVGKQVDFSLTTNATLLKPEIIEFLAENQVGRDDFDRRPARGAGQVPRLPQRHRQLRRRRAEDQGAAEAAYAAGRSARGSR